MICALLTETEIIINDCLQMSVEAHEESESQQEFQNDEESQDNNSNEDQDHDGDKLHQFTEFTAIISMSIL